MTGEATQLLHDWRAGSLEARDRLVGLLYGELRELAGRQFGHERAAHTLQPTALVSEAYQRLAALERIDWRDRAHFIGVAARLMREILIDHARGRARGKRDGGERLSLTQVDLPAEAPGVDLLDLDAALTRLEAIDPARARLVELRYFGGLSIEETAEALGQSPATVKRHWQSTRLWLYEAMAGGAAPADGRDGAG